MSIETASPPETGEVASPEEPRGNPPELDERLAALERLVRGMARDNLAAARSQRESEAALKALFPRFDELDLTIKGLTQTIWRSTQESQGFAQNAEQHFAGALRELEARIRDEMQWQLHKSTLQAVFPALDDLDLVIAQQAAIDGDSGTDDGLLGAIRLVRQKLMDGLRTMGLEEIPIEPGLTRHDSTLHEGVEPDVHPVVLEGREVPVGTILFVRRSGYWFKGRIFRVPQVIVKR